MWDAMIIIGLLGTMVAIVGSITMGIKRNPIWKKWLAGAGLAFVLMIVGVENAPAPGEPGITPSNQAVRTVAQKPNDTYAVNLEKATVVKVVDGDTLAVNVAGEEKRVRLILVDTPESVHPDESRNNGYGKLASDYTASQIKAGQTVYLQKDVSETDKYGRLLRYVWLEPPTDAESESEIRTKMYNAKLLLEGYAQIATYPPDVKYADMFTNFQREARESDKGLWGVKEEPAKETVTTLPVTTPAPAPATVAPEPQPQVEPQTATVYVTNTGAKYHRDGCQYLSKSRIPMSLTDAKAAGYTPCKVCKP
jgi:micrococcal nuclease